MEAVMCGLNMKQLGELVAAVKENPDMGRTVWRAKSHWTNGFLVKSETHGHEVVMDEDNAFGGTNAGPNPVEMVLASLGSCLSMGFALNSAVMGIEVKNLDIDLDGNIDLQGYIGLQPEPDQDPLPKFTEIRAKVSLNSTGSKEQEQTLLERVFATSPVGTTLANGVRIVPELV